MAHDGHDHDDGHHGRDHGGRAGHDGHEHAGGHEHGDGHGTHAGRGHAAHAPRARAPLATGAGHGKLLFLDAFSGIAGDMLVAALVDLGVPERVVLDAVRAVGLEGCDAHFHGAVRSGIAARTFHVHAGTQSSRDHAAIRAMIENAGALTDGARSLALRAFAVLADAEATVHDTTPDRVHFHEVGAADSIADIVGAAAALDHLGAEVACSPLPMGRGLVQSEHGPIPSPAPATLLCLAGVPTYDAGIDFELVTPTGACLVKAAAREFVRWPRFSPERTGWGAGTRELADRPNVLRAVLGIPTGPRLGATHGAHVVVETNVDDLTGELAAVALQRAYESGALDAWSTPIGMKKGRPALMLAALATREDAERVARALLAESTSLGVRLREVDRIERSRRIVEVQTPYGPIAVKIADGDGLPANVAPEHEACRAAAERHGVPVKHVYAAAIAEATRASRG
jgi:hypothetical protein